MRRSTPGFILVEAVIAIGIFAVSVVGLVGLSSLARGTSNQGRDTVQAANYLQEGMEAVRIIRDSDWTAVTTDGTYRLSVAPGNTPPWQLVSGGSENIGKYQRTVQISPVRREDTDGDGELSAGDKIVISGGAFDDSETKRIEVRVSWQVGSRTVTRSVSGYLTHWQ